MPDQVEMFDTKLIIIDGMPGSGKSTTGEMLRSHFSMKNTPARFYHELEENHPLRIYGWTIEELESVEDADRFCRTVTQLYSDFVEKCLCSSVINIMEAYLFQDTICLAYMTGMEHSRIVSLFDTVSDILRPLNPSLIFFQQMNVERNWRWICKIRGPEFTEGRCGIYTDDDFVQAGKFWGDIQEFTLGLIQRWKYPKLLIQNHDYRWDEYTKRIFEFLNV